jgi:hypothetical protein
VWTPLAVRQIAAQNADAGGGQILRYRNQQRCIHVSAGAMGQYQEVAGGTFSTV